MANQKKKIRITSFRLFIQLTLVITLCSACSKHDWKYNNLETDDLSMVQKVVMNSLKKADPQDILVVFDVDRTLTVPVHPATDKSNVAAHKKIFKKIYSQASLEEQILMLDLSLLQSRHTLVDPSSLSLFKLFKKKGIKTIAATNAITGPLQGVQRFERFRFETLFSLGVDFREAFPKDDEITLDHLPSFLERYPVFYKGVLVTDTAQLKGGKAIPLDALLKRLNYTPKKLIFIDDNASVLEEITEFFKKERPSFSVTTILYTKASAITAPSITKKEFKAFWRRMLNLAKKEIKNTEQPSP